MPGRGAIWPACSGERRGLQTRAGEFDSAPPAPRSQSAHREPFGRGAGLQNRTTGFDSRAVIHFFPCGDVREQANPAGREPALERIDTATSTQTSALVHQLRHLPLTLENLGQHESAFPVIKLRCRLRDSLRHRPAPPPDHPRKYDLMGGRVGVRAGAEGGTEVPPHLIIPRAGCSRSGRALEAREVGAKPTPAAIVFRPIDHQLSRRSLKPENPGQHWMGRPCLEARVSQFGRGSGSRSRPVRVRFPPRAPCARSPIGRRHDAQTVGSVGSNPSARTNNKERSG